MKLEQYADQTNWPTDLVEAKVFANAAVDHFKYKNKVPTFRREIESAATIKKLQFLIINAIVSGEGLGVLK